MSAAVTLVEMSAKRGGATHGNVPQDFLLRCRRLMRATVVALVKPHDVGDLKMRSPAVHSPGSAEDLGRRSPEQVERATCSGKFPGADMRVLLGRA